jgi:type IV secretion system protein VirB8
MGLKDWFNKNKQKEDVNQRKASKANASILKSWTVSNYESVVIQRNVLFIFSIACLIVVTLSVLVVRYVRSTRSIEPFVIEIEKKTGVPTVVDPVTIAAYSADDAVRRYFVWEYVKAREEFFSSTYFRNFNTVVRVLSTPDVYFGDYRPKFSVSNPSSPYNLYGSSTTRNLALKSIIFTSDTTAQVRVAMYVKGMLNMVLNKILFIEFKFENVEMNAEERLINPLGFRVTLYRIDDERPGT